MFLFVFLLICSSMSLPVATLWSHRRRGLSPYHDCTMMAWNPCNRKYGENMRMYERGEGLCGHNTHTEEKGEVCSEPGRSMSCDTTSREKISAKSYYLVTSPGALKKTLGISFGILLLKTIRHNVSSDLKLNVAFKYTQLVLPFVASACCAAQVAINILLTGAGCVGLNKRFGPLRPIFLALLINSTLTLSVLSSFRLASLALLSWLVALMPEIVHAYNRSNIRRNSVATDLTFSRSDRIKVNIPTMGCVGCVSKVNSAIAKVTSSMDPGARAKIVKYDSWLVDPKGGIAEIEVTYDQDEDALEALKCAVANEIKDAGFNCSI